MSSWASRRKSIYLGIALGLVGVLAFIIFWKYWYKAPLCTDGIKNGDETGIDCGGSCSLICESEALPPITRWDPRLFQIAPGIWTTVVYVENPNTDADATYLPYTFTIYDSKNQIIATRTSATILPKHKTVGIFEGPINIPQDKIPRRAVFDLGKNIKWQKNTLVEYDLTVTHSPLLREDTSPRVEATIKNNDIQDVRNVELVAAIFDGQDNVIAASRTFVEKIAKNESREVFFTWPQPFDLGEKACMQPSNIMLAIDRSGSMASEGTQPPEPLTSVKDAAITFVDTLKQSDKVGVVSFATEASNPPESLLSNDFVSSKTKIGEINISKSGTQYTNIFDALRNSWAELVSLRSEAASAPVIVLLTDGRATYPKDPLGKTEADDIAYAEKEALREAQDIKKSGIEIFTIGLGKDVSVDFLKKIASKDENFFGAPQSGDLEKIYTTISSKICKEVPARIEITYKVFGTQ